MFKKRCSLPMVLLLSLCLSIFLAGCGSPPDFQTGEGDLLAANYKTIEELKASVLKAKTDDESYDLYNLNFCFELNEVPEEYQLNQINVGSEYCCLTYVNKDQIISNEVVTDVTDWIDLEWYRGVTSGALQSTLKSYVGDTPFVQCKENQDYYYKKLTTCTTVIWSQDGYLFHANVPLRFTEGDILKYCIAKKIALR